MGYKTLELTVISAKDLKNVNLIGKMDVYVVVHLSDDPKSKQKTPVHQDGGTNPSWNYTMRFNINDDPATNQGKYLIFQLLHEHTFGADKDLGEVRVSIKELLGSVGGKDPNSPQFLTYQVKRASGKAKGELKFSYKFVDLGQKFGSGSGYKPSATCSSSSSGSSYAAPPPMAVYPPPGQPYPPPITGYHGGGMYPPPSAGYPAPSAGYPTASAGYPAASAGPSDGGHHVYPPPQKGSSENPSQQTPPMGVPYAAPMAGHPPYGGYPAPPAGYGYPPAPGGYPPSPGGYPAYPPTGYPQAQQPQKPKKNSNFGMGLGAGLIGGALGGLVLGEMVDDAFDDGGGFDF